MHSSVLYQEFLYLGVRKAVTSENKKVWSTVLNVLIGLFLIVGCHAFINKVFAENPLSAAVVVAISVIVGVVVFAALEVFTLKKSGSVSAFIYAGVVGAMTNTILVMGGIFVLYKDAYANALSIDAGAVLGVIGGVISFNGVIEAIVAAIIVAALGVALSKIKPIRQA